MANRTFEDPATGDTLRFVKTSAETDGELLEVEVSYTPVHGKPPAHYHPHQHEHFEVLAGSITVQIGDEQREYQAGESFDVPPGAVHAMWNDRETTTQMNWQIRPALKSQQFFETMWGMTQDGKFGARGGPNLLLGAVLMDYYTEEFRLASPPQPIQKLLFGILAPIGRVLGHKPYYSSDQSST